MSNVIQAEFGVDESDDRGYLLDDNNAIIGMHVANIAAMKMSSGDVVIGTESGREITNPTIASMDEMNEFCLMWLLIFNQDVIKEDL